MTADVSLRQAKPADRPALHDIRQAAIYKAGPWAYTQRQVELWAATAANKGVGIKPNNCTTVVADAGKFIFGFGTVNREMDNIELLYVHPDRFGEGIGQRLLTKIEDIAVRAGTCELSTDASLNALGFYRQMEYDLDRYYTKTLQYQGEKATYPVVQVSRSLSDDADNNATS